jgi:hypothetical protein
MPVSHCGDAGGDAFYRIDGSAIAEAISRYNKVSPALAALTTPLMLALAIAFTAGHL